MLCVFVDNDSAFYCSLEKKSSGSDFQKKKVELYNAAREQGRVVVRDTLAYLCVFSFASTASKGLNLWCRNEIKTTMADMKSRETSVEKSLQDLPSLLAHRDVRRLRLIYMLVKHA